MNKTGIMNKLIFTSAQPHQLEEIFVMYTKAIQEMNANKIYQWDERYPDKEILAEDISKQEMTVVLQGTEMVAAYVLNQECDEEYKNGKWKDSDAKYYIIHRLCVNPKFQNQGIARRVMLHIEKELKQQGIECIRLDAFTENPYALKLYRSLGYEITGYVEWRKGRFCLMEKLLGCTSEDKVAIVCCSNGQAITYKEKIKRLQDTITQIGLVPVMGEFVYEKDSVFSGSAQQRAESLMKFYLDNEIKAIFDISGGDIANEILPYLDFDVIAESKKLFWGYSDLTTIINAIYAKTGKESVLYQVRNLIYDDAENQINNFRNTVMNGTNDLFDFKYSFVQKEEMYGTVIGGNIRCLLKLAGTEYWPNMNRKILLLEAYGGIVPQMVTYLNQLSQMGVFKKISGILLGTFTKMESENSTPTMIELVKRYAGTEIPIACTNEIGHGTNSKGIVIGKDIQLVRRNL